MSTNTPVKENELTIPYLRSQLSVARNEFNNLRQQLRALTQSHQQEVEKIRSMLTSLHSEDCSCSATSLSTSAYRRDSSPGVNSSSDEGLFVRYIGIISTWFPERKAIPRQPGICVGSRGKLVLFNSVFTNPEHALEGLEGFSHMWILFHFHKNDSTHVRAKVAPPRLNGIRTGVFGTRSPHRPSPIGLSLVSIEKIEGCCIYFSGVDMMDGTPVVDIKPYIPQYDNPVHCISPSDKNWSRIPAQRQMDGGEESDSVTQQQGNGHSEEGGAAALSCSMGGLSPTQSSDTIGEREAPDGEEGVRSSQAAPVTKTGTSQTSVPTQPQAVRVPAWVNQSLVSKLTVNFSKKALEQLNDVGKDSEAVKIAITCVLQEDPRSVYLREKWGNQYYTFLIHNLHVSCQFDDSIHTVFVFQIKSAGKNCECGQPEWQCPIHGEADD